MDGIFMGTTASLSPALHVGSINSHNAAEINCRALVPADHIRPPAPACPLPLVIRVGVGVCGAGEGGGSDGGTLLAWCFKKTWPTSCVERKAFRRMK